jgi:(2Fe-2S) ferredoxin
MQKGANDVAGRLRLEVIRRKLDAQILVNNCGTIDLCDIGPNIVIYPDNIIYRGVTVKDIPDIIEHLKGGPVVERLLLNADVPEEVSRATFYRAAVSSGPTSPESAFRSLAEQHGFDERWVDEQMRRGFIARKPAEEGSTITVTSKALHRYRIDPPPPR